MYCVFLSKIHFLSTRSSECSVNHSLASFILTYSCTSIWLHFYMCLRQCFCWISILYCPEKYSEHLSFTSKKTGNVYKTATCTNKIKIHKIEVECTNVIITVREICFQGKPVYSLKCIDRENHKVWGREQRDFYRNSPVGIQIIIYGLETLKKFFHSQKVRVHSNICNFKYTDLIWSLYCDQVSTQKQYRIFFCYSGKKVPYLKNIFTLKSQMLALNTNARFISQVIIRAISPTLYL